MKKVKTWVKEQPTYTLHRQARKRYPTRRYNVHDIDEQWQADLAEMQGIASKNQGYRYILTVIDIFSRYAWVRSLKSKRNEDVVVTFSNIFQEGHIPKRVCRQIKEKEFENRHVRALFATHNIELFTVKSAYKATIVERFNRMLKHHLWRFFTSENKQKWTEVLQDVVYAYNHSIHRSIKQKPADVSADNVGEIRDLMSQRPESSQGKDDIQVRDSVCAFLK